MIRLMQFLFFGHIHKWKILEKRDLIAVGNARGLRFIQQCECCGKVIKRDLI